MKTTKFLFILLLPLLFVLGVKGQGYHKLLQDNVDWDVLSVNGSMNPFCGYVAGCRFFLRGDTTIQGNDYKIINCIKIISPQPGPFCPPFFVTQDTVFRQGYIREDTIAKKVFVYDHYDGDALLYDFSLSVGDTLKYSSFNWCGDLIVDSIGTITLFNSETRKIFFFLGSDEYCIEGIGGSQGLNNAMCWFESMYEPFCVLKNGVAIYNFKSGSCFQVMSIDNYQVSGNFSIYPNPANSEIIISSDNPKEKIVSLYDLNGRECFRDVMRESIVIPLYNISSGMYIVKIISDNMLVFREILIIQKN